MKIAISATGKELSDNVSDVFGRCPYFILAEVAEGKIISSEAVKNVAESQAGGAGIAAAQLMVDQKAEVVIAKSVGPRAMDVLNQFKIMVYTGEGTVEKAVADFVAKK